MLSIPITFDERMINDLAKELYKQVFKEFKSMFEMMMRVNALPDYPDKKEVMKGLRIGASTLETWIEMGLPVQRWSKTVYRFDKNKIRIFLEEHFEGKMWEEQE